MSPSEFDTGARCADHVGEVFPVRCLLCERESESLGVATAAPVEEAAPWAPFDEEGKHMDSNDTEETPQVDFMQSAYVRREDRPGYDPYDAIVPTPPTGEVTSDPGVSGRSVYAKRNYNH